MLCSKNDLRVCISSSFKIYAEPVVVQEYHILKKDRGTKNEYFSYSKEVHMYFNGRTTKRHLGHARCLIFCKSQLEHYAPNLIVTIFIIQVKFSFQFWVLIFIYTQFIILSNIPASRKLTLTPLHLIGNVCSSSLLKKKFIKEKYS